MKYLGIDYGTKRVGIAVSDAAGTIAFPRGVITNNGGLMQALGDLIKKENIEKVVVGDTRSHGGGENPVTAEAEAFMRALEAESGVPVARAFEVFSSIEASRYAPETKQHDDSAAAAIILQRFLDMHASR